MAGTDYRLDFGQHQNNTLQQIPRDYISWMIRKKIHEKKPDLQAALIAHNYLPPAPIQDHPPTPPTTPKSNRKRRASDLDDVEISPSVRRKLAISIKARKNGTMLNYDGSSYILDFGQHAGERVGDIPHSYIDYMIREKIPDKKSDLAAALRDQGFLRNSNESENTPPASQPLPAPYTLDFGQYAGKKLAEIPQSYIDYVIREKIPNKRPNLAAALREQGFLGASDAITPPNSQTALPSSQIAWSAPNVNDTTDVRFFNPHSQAPRWISDGDALKYFALNKAMLVERGINLVTETDLRRETLYGELISVWEGPKRWLYQVYACAKRFGTPPHGGNAEIALDDFLGKNQRREGEIWDAMGFGA